MDGSMIFTYPVTSQRNTMLGSLGKAFFSEVWNPSHHHCRHAIRYGLDWANITGPLKQQSDEE
jgi:hypothetical protein